MEQLAERECGWLGQLTASGCGELEHLAEGGGLDSTSCQVKTTIERNQETPQLNIRVALGLWSKPLGRQSTRKQQQQH